MRRECVFMASSNNHVAEMPGLYGPFTMAERVLQKIWLQRDFDLSRAGLVDGRKLAVRSTGKWNLLGGPDFRGARLLFGEQEVSGDIEVHFHAADWRAHGHATDPAYAGVVLHVVLFPLSRGEKPATMRDGRELPTLILLPLIHRGLEEYASDDALETLTARDEWRHFAELAARPVENLKELLRENAQKRWRQKVHFAKIRLGKLGWNGAAHHTALEILGYRQNRAAMLAVAEKYPLECWVSALDPRVAFAQGGTFWQLQGVRPANHPLTRLQQYRRWVDACPDWPERVAQLVAALPGDDPLPDETKLARKSFGLMDRRKIVVRDLLGGAIGGTRVDNLVCDGFLPLLAAGSADGCFALWFNWFLGDLPGQVRRTLPKLGVAGSRGQPLCHGYAQGLLGWLIDHDARASG
jgi:hypothetical protein